MEKLLTVIVPTYNMEALLKRCLNSVCINDTALEVVVIIDGATDRSSEIAHEYQDKYPQIFRVIEKENGNYGSCINRGLAEAKGKYINVLDADDLFNTEALTALLFFLKDSDADLVITNYCICNAYGEIIERKKFNLPTKTLFTAKDLTPLGPHMAMHAVTYKTDNLHNICYQQTEGISYTDQEWIYKPMTTVKSFVYADLDLYKYVTGREGQTMDIKALRRNMHHNLMVLGNMIETYNNSQNDTDIYGYLRTRIECYTEYIYSLYLFNIKQMNTEPLALFDKNLRTLCPQLYKYTATLKAGKLPFIRLWRILGYPNNDYGIINFFRYRRYNPLVLLCK